jgi:hypothetical protein
MRRFFLAEDDGRRLRVAPQSRAHASSSRLKNLLGITSGDLYINDVIQQLAIVEPAVMVALGVVSSQRVRIRPVSISLSYCMIRS